jgi:hybrid cluster-associated redox disulfide protein
MTKTIQEQVSKDILISDIVSKYPDTISILIENGMHCIGCSASMFETLEGGFKGHGMTDEEIEKIMLELNKFIAENPVKKSN